MKKPLIAFIILGAALMSWQATENVRLAGARIEQELSPAQVAAMLAELEAKGIKLHPAKYWNTLK